MMKLHMHKLLCTTTLVSLCLLAAVPAYADAVPAAASAAAQDTGAITDIVVTARRTSEHLQTTPVAITALDAKALEQRQIASVFQIAQATPSLSVQSGGTGNASLIYLAIRGNAQNSPNSASDAAVGIYVDGVYYGRPIVGNLGLLDIASAEVLRGTQGTLFGRNTTGGALNMTTVQPNGKFGGYLRATYGNYNLASVEGAVTLPIKGDELSLRVAGSYASHDAYGNDSLRAVAPAKLKYDVAARATLKYAPNAIPLTVTVSGDIIRNKQSYNDVALIGVNPTGGAALLYGSKNISQYLAKRNNFYGTASSPNVPNASIQDPYNGNSASGVYGTIAYDLGGVKIKSITAYRHSNTHDQSDIDATPADIISYRSNYVQSQISEELQVSGKTSKLDWIVGGMFFHEYGTEKTPSFAFDHTDLQYLAGPFEDARYANGQISPSSLNNADFSATSKALFGQFNYHFTDKLRLTAGVRYTWDVRSINRHGVNNIESTNEYIINPAAEGYPITVVHPNTCAVGANAGTVNSPNCNDPHKANFQYPAWTFGLDYELARGAFIYAKTGGAALAGGFNTRQTPPGKDSFQPEKVKDIEAGFKGDFFDRHLRTNLAGFYNWRNNSQNIINSYYNNQLTQYTQNAGNIRAYGVEFEGTVVPWAGMEMTLSASRLWAHYQKGSFIEQGYNGTYDASGQTVEQAPKYTLSLGATQTIPFEGGNFRVGLNYAYSSSRSLGQDTPDSTNLDTPANGNTPKHTGTYTPAEVAAYATSNSLSTVAGYGLLNGKVEIALDNGLSLTVWGKNLLQKDYYVSNFNGYLTLGTAVAFQGTPRTIGLTAAYKF